METPLIDSEVIDGDVCEVRIIAGLSPQDVDKLLHMAEASGLFGSEEMSEVEDMSWGVHIREMTLHANSCRQ